MSVKLTTRGTWFVWTQWPTAASLWSGFRRFSCINVVVYDAIVICHPIFSLWVFPTQSSNMHGERRWAFSVLSSPWWQTSISLRLCVGRSQQGFMMSMTHGTVFRLPVATHGYSYHLTNFKPPAAAGFDGNTNLIMAGISLEIVPHSSSKTSTSITLALSSEPLVQLLPAQAVFLIGMCPATSIAM